MTRVAITIDVGGTSLKHGLVTDAYELASVPGRTELDTRADSDTILSVFVEVMHDYLNTLNSYELAGFGFGFPGHFDYDKGISLISGFGKYEALFEMDIHQEFRNRLNIHDLPMRFRNDAEAAIVGEACYGAGKVYNRVIGITLGHGFGSAFLIDGVPQKDGKGVPLNGWLYSHKWGEQEAEDLFSTKGVRAFLDKKGYDLDDAKSASGRAREGDRVLAELFAHWGKQMGGFLQGYVNDFDADAVLVQGGIANAFDLFGETFQSVLSVPVRQGQLKQAALLGLADLIFAEE